MADIHHFITIQASPKRVFEAITTKEGLQGWWTDDTKADPHLGSIAEFRFMNGAVVFQMKIDEFVPPKRLRWTCVGGPKEWKGTKVTFDLAPAEEGGTNVRFKHGGWRSVKGIYATCNTTWGHLMHYLKGYSEGNSPGPFFKRSRG